MARWKGTEIDDDTVAELSQTAFGRQLLDQAAEGTTPIGRLKQYATGERSVLFDAAEGAENLMRNIFGF